MHACEMRACERYVLVRYLYLEEMYAYGMHAAEMHDYDRSCLLELRLHVSDVPVSDLCLREKYAYQRSLAVCIFRRHLYRRAFLAGTYVL